MDKSITLTSKLGYFIFDVGVNLSHAKLIRDTVTGEFFAPKGGKRIKTKENAYSLMVNHPSNILSDIQFELVML